MCLSVVIPVYNSANSLTQLVSELDHLLSRSVREWEVVLVNDGSTDCSFDVIRQLSSVHPWVRGIDLMYNVGQQGALLCGIRAARFEVIATMDDDLQHPPQELPRLLAALDASTDVVYGSPRGEKRSLSRYLASRATRAALKVVVGGRAASGLSAFRVFRTDLRRAFERYSGPVGSIDAMLTWGTSRVVFIRVEHRPRTAGRSTYTLRKLVVLACDFTTSFSVLPLRVVGLAGATFALSGVVTTAIVLARYARSGTLAGVPLAIALMAVISGVQLFAAGIIGEYVSRMHARVMDRPSYVVRESTNAPHGMHAA
jgi:undecaprenyl-phosphate 4-deoxy-4-formamido-L-arabinose transferase